jgi:hypothetical protein
MYSNLSVPIHVNSAVIHYDICYCNTSNWIIIHQVLNNDNHGRLHKYVGCNIIHMYLQTMGFVTKTASIFTV